MPPKVTIAHSDRRARPAVASLFQPAGSSLALWSWPAYLILALIYLLARVPALPAMPLFNDEAVYLRRAQEFPALLSDTLSEGKLLQELFLAALLHLPGDPLILSRALSVACGLATLAGLALFGRALGRARAGLLAGLLYAGAPMAALHDRLGLPDSMLTMVACFILLASIRFAQTPRPARRCALAIGALVGLASLVKLPGLFLLCIPALATLILPVSWAERRRRLALLRWTAIVALACIAVLAPAHYGGNERGKTDFGSLASRGTLLAQNAWFVGQWLASYLPGPLLALPLVWLAAARRAETWRLVAFLVTSGLAIHAIFLGVGTMLYPRYLMPAWPALLMACALAAGDLWRMAGPARWVGRATCVAALGVTLAWDGFFAIQLQRDPAAAPLVARDRLQYLETWTAGYRLPDILGVVEQLAAERNGIVLVGYDRPRLIHLAPQIYLRSDPRIHFEALDLGAADAPEQLHRLAERRPAYLLLDDQENQALDAAGRFPEARLLRAFENPLGTMRFYLYEQQHLPSE